MADITGHPIKEIVKVGAAAGGQIAHFTIELEDGNQLTLTCKYERINTMILSIEKAAQLAAAERLKIDPNAGQPGDALPSEPFEMTGYKLGVIQNAQGQKAIGLTIETTRGLALDIGIVRQHARKLIRDLQKMLDEPPELPRRSIH